MDKRRPRKYELAVLVTIISVLAFLLLDVLGSLREEIEEAAMQSEVAALRVELLDRLAHREVYGGRFPDSSNPLVWANRQPEAYVGELESPPEESGVWYFDRKREELVYRFRSLREARFRLERNAGPKGAPAMLSGVGLRRVEDDPAFAK